MGLLIGVGATKPQFAYDSYYGIEWDTTVSNPIPKRVGKAELHASLPIQSQMRRCILNDNGSVVDYLDENNSLKTSTGATADLSGAQGNVMVEIPNMYVRFEQNGTKCRALISEHALPGFMKWPRKYVSAYEAALDRESAKLMSIVNNAPRFRGGNNNATYDSTDHTLLGRPATNRSLAEFRTSARKNRDSRWNCNTYDVHKTLFWLFAIEYCNFNSQDAYNAELTHDGFRQGGLGDGVTNLDTGKWSTWCAFNPFIPCGYTNSLGNRTGVVAFQLPAGYGTPLITNVPSYRGVENPFGHVWKWTDGILCNVNAESNGGTSELFICPDVKDYSSSLTANYIKRGEIPRAGGYIKEIILGDFGEIMPKSIGGGSTIYFCDQFYTHGTPSGASLRGVFFCCGSSYGANAGLLSLSTDYDASSVLPNIGSRLCYIPNT